MIGAKRKLPVKHASQNEQGVPRYFLDWFERLPKKTRWTKKRLGDLFKCKVAKDYRNKYVIRLLRESDIRIGSGYYETLSSLRKEDRISIAKGKRRFQERCKLGIKTFVLVESGMIVATTSVLLEPKSIHDGGRIAHVEDVATMVGYGSNGFASELLRRAILVAIRKGCYKIILDCSMANIPFYLKQGFLPIEMCMRMDL